MSRKWAVTDEALAAAIDHRSARARPGGLREAIMAEVAATHQQRRPWLAAPAWPGLLRVGEWAERRLLWLLAVVALLAALSAGAVLVGSRFLERAPAFPLDPPGFTRSGVEVLAPVAHLYSRLIADRDGNLWAAGRGEITRYTPATGSARTWTVADDARFAAANAVAARAGGVWLVGDQTIRRFDGTAFREVVEVPAQVAAAVEARDGSLWVKTPDGVLLRLAGSAAYRVDVPGTAANAIVGAIAADAAGRVWIEGQDWAASYGSREWGASYDGSGWRLFDWRTGVPLGTYVRIMTGAPDGSLLVVTKDWAGSGFRLGRFDGSSWTSLTATWPRPPGIWSIAVAPDSSIWTSDGSITVGHLAGGSWTLFGGIKGLPVADYAPIGSSIVATKDGVFVGTDAGLYKLVAGRWQLATPATAPAGPGGSPQIVPVSRDEGWALSSDGAWHFSNGSWTFAPVPGGYARDLVRSGDGTMWVTADERQGVFVRRGSDWVQVATGSGPLATDRAGTVWLGGSAVRSFVFDGSAWRERPAMASTRLITTPESIAVQDDGTIWMGQEYDAQGERPGLVRYRGGAWESVRPSGASATFAIRDLTVGDGSLWAVGVGIETTECCDVTNWVGRFDGATWTLFPAGGSLPIPADGMVAAVAAARDGTILAATSSGLLRFDGSAWTYLVPGLAIYGVSIAPDGTVWATGAIGIARLDGSVVGR